MTTSEIREKCIQEELEKAVRKVAQLDVDIAVLEETNPNAQVAKRTTPEGEEVVITAGVYIADLKRQREGTQKRVEVIEKLIAA